VELGCHSEPLGEESRIDPAEGQASAARIIIEEGLLTTEVTEGTEAYEPPFKTLRVLCDLCG